MKILVFHILLIATIGCSSIPSKEVSKGDPELVRTARGVLNYRDVPYSGHVIDYYENGNVRSNTSYLEGKREGLIEGFYSSGQLKFERVYVRGEKHGTHRGYFSDGSKQFEYTFNYGENVGTHYEWNKNGNLSVESNYKNGQPFGLQRVWRPDGKLRSNYVIREDGRKYGLVGIKRCKNIDTEEERVKPLTASVYEK